MKFCEFIERYKNRLTNINSLEGLIEKSKDSYRIKKILIPYFLKDNDTFNKVFEISKTDEYTVQLLNDAICIMDRLLNGDFFDSVEMKKLIAEILNNINLPTYKVNNSKIDFWDLNGYAKIFNNYLVNERLEKMDFPELENIDFNNLIVA